MPREGADEGLTRRERAKLAKNGGDVTPTKPGKTGGGDTAPATGPDKSAEQKQLDYSTAVPKFTNQGKVFEVGPSTTGVTTKYDATAARAAWGEDKCLPFLFTRSMPGCTPLCPKPGDPDHAEGGAAHTLPEGAKGRKAFNLKRADSGGKSGGKGGKGRSKSGGKDGGKDGGKKGGKPAAAAASM